MNENASNSQSNREAVRPDSSNILVVQTRCQLIRNMCQDEKNIVMEEREKHPQKVKIKDHRTIPIRSHTQIWFPPGRGTGWPTN